VSPAILLDRCRFNSVIFCSDLKEFSDCRKIVIQEIASNHIAVLEKFLNEVDRLSFLDFLELHTTVNLASIRQRLLTLVFYNQVFVYVCLSCVFSVWYPNCLCSSIKTPADSTAVDYTNLLFAEGSAIVNFTKASRTSKLYLVGNSRAGKTSLRHALEGVVPGTILRTRGIEFVDISVGDHGIDQSRPTFRVLDFGGHAEFRVAQNMFVETRESVFALVFNLRNEPMKAKSQVQEWIRYLLSLRDPKSHDKLSVILVGTHFDVAQDAVDGATYDLIKEVITTEFRGSVNIEILNKHLLLVDLKSGAMILQDSPTSQALTNLKEQLVETWKSLTDPSQALQHASPIRTILRSLDFCKSPIITCEALCQLVFETAKHKNQKFGHIYAPDPSEDASEDVLGYYEVTDQSADRGEVHPAYKAVLTSMKTAGEIFFAGELTTESHVVVDMTWFCSEVLGGLFAASKELLVERFPCDFGTPAEKTANAKRRLQWGVFYDSAKLGPVPVENLPPLSDKSSNEQLLPLIQEVGVCYEFVKVSKPIKPTSTEPVTSTASFGTEGSTVSQPAYVFPSLLARNTKSLESLARAELVFNQFTKSSDTHVCVRLTPNDIKTQIPLGFFSQLQVQLRSSIGPDYRVCEDMDDLKPVPMYQNLAYVEIDGCNVSALVFLQETNEHSAIPEDSIAAVSQEVNFDAECVPKAVFVHVRGEKHRGDECRELLAKILAQCDEVLRAYRGMAFKLHICSSNESRTSFTPKIPFQEANELISWLQGPDTFTSSGDSIAALVGLDDRADHDGLSFI
jgi:GTPase SAR1 family protein